MSKLIDKILSKLRSEKGDLQLKIQRQENDWVTIMFHIGYKKRCDLIDSIENNAEISPDFLYALAEAIRSKELNKDSWIAEEKEYWDAIYKRMRENED